VELVRALLNQRQEKPRRLLDLEQSRAAGVELVPVRKEARGGVAVFEPKGRSRPERELQLGEQSVRQHTIEHERRASFGLRACALALGLGRWREDSGAQLVLHLERVELRVCLAMPALARQEQGDLVLRNRAASNPRGELRAPRPPRLCCGLRTRLDGLPVARVNPCCATRWLFTGEYSQPGKRIALELYHSHTTQRPNNRGNERKSVSHPASGCLHDEDQTQEGRDPQGTNPHRGRPHPHRGRPATQRERPTQGARPTQETHRNNILKLRF